jgi:hypothetical protein
MEKRMAAAGKTSERSHSSFADLLGTCPMHAGEPAVPEVLEIRGRIERLPADGRFVVLVPSAGDASVLILELDVADVESCDVLVEDSSGRKTCRLVLSQEATLRRRYTAPRLRLELSADAHGEDTRERLPDSADPITAWKTAAWRTSVYPSPSQLPAPFPTPFQPANELQQQTGAPQAYTPSMAQLAYIESYQGQLYYYFPHGYGGEVSSAPGAAAGAPVPYPGAATTVEPSYNASGYGVTTRGARPCGCTGSAGQPVTPSPFSAQKVTS